MLRGESKHGGQLPGDVWGHWGGGAPPGGWLAAAACPAGCDGPGSTPASHEWDRLQHCCSVQLQHSMHSVTPDYTCCADLPQGPNLIQNWHDNEMMFFIWPIHACVMLITTANAGFDIGASSTAVAPDHSSTALTHTEHHTPTCRLTCCIDSSTARSEPSTLVLQVSNIC